MEMCRSLIAILLGACVAVFPSSVWATAQDEKLREEVRAAWKKREEAVRTLRIEWTFQNLTPKGALDAMFPELGRLEGAKSAQPRPPTDTTREGRGVLLLDGSKARLRLDDFIWHVSSQDFLKQELDSTYDDTASSTSSRSAGGTAEVVTIHKADWNTACDVNTWPICMAFRGTHPGAMSGRDISTYHTARRMNLDGRQVIELVRERNEIAGEGKLWVEPAQDYAAIRRDEYDRKGGLIYRITIRNVRADTGMWVPSIWTTTVYQEQKLVRRVQTTVRSTVINVPTTPNDFVLVPGNKAHVVDYTGERTREHITRDGKPPREILPSEHGFDYADLERTEPGELLASSHPNFFTRNRTLVMIVGASLLAVLTLIILRRRYRSAEGPAQSSHTTL